MLDFGRNVFDGSGCWLEIAVRHAGSPDPFTILTPRQSLRPTPYSIYTLKAETLTGPIPDSQLSTNVARLDANQTFSGSVTFASISGNGAGLSNVVATALAAKFAQKFWRVSIPFVTVGNPGNDPDELTGKGSVAYTFRIGKFEINNLQYAAFLNAVAADDPHSLYSTNMTVNPHGGLIRSGFAGEYSYAVKPGMEHHPVVWVDYNDALRFCNWLHNGQPSGSEDASTTEDGAYTLTAENTVANTVTRNPNARFWIPSDDEWYKAAYHQPFETGGPPSDYWLYPTRSEDTPFSEPSPGAENSVNTCCGKDREATDVGAYYLSPSYYGTFDQGGNVQEWTEEILYVTNRRLRGGSWYYNEFYTKSTDLEFDTPDYDAEAIGFRVAAPAEP
jgi:formylglycine-generating enzyme required for sulfatase activity